MEAVNAATPSFPFGSEAEPTLNKKRKLMSGDVLGKSTDAMLDGAFPARTRPRPGAAIAKINPAEISASRLLTRILFLLVREDNCCPLRLDKILLCHLLNILRRYRSVQVVKLVQRFGCAPQRNVRSKIRGDRFRVVQAQRKAILEIRFHRVKLVCSDRSRLVRVERFDDLRLACTRCPSDP